jgi:adenylate cyclase
VAKDYLYQWMARKPLLLALVFAVLTTLGISAIRMAGYLELAELTTHDLLLTAAARTTKQTSPVVLVGVTEEEIQSLGQWPLTDAVLAGAIERLLGMEPRVIGVDIYRDQPVPPGGEQLDTLIAASDRVAFIHKIGGGAAIPIQPPAILRGTDSIGFSDMVIDPDGTVRRGLLFLDDGEQFYYSLPLVLALRYLADDGIFPQAGEPDPTYLRLGKTTIPPFEANDGAYVDADAGGYQFLLNFAGGSAPFRQFSLTEVMDSDAVAQVVRDNIVILGVTADSVKDAFVTPLSHGDTDESAMPGITLHAHIVSQLLRMARAGEPPLHGLADRWEYTLIFLWGILGALAAVYIKQFWRFALVILGGLGVIVMVPYIALLNQLWLPLIPPLLAWVLSAGLVMVLMRGSERSQRKQLMDLFARNVSADVAAEIWKQRDHFLEGGRLAAREVTATVLFSDLQNFTPVSEKLGPARLMEWLNHYMETMAGLVMRYGGIVDDYYGDAIMADFGVPLERNSETEIDRDARSAVDCALAMRGVVAQLNRENLAEGLPPVCMRVGICTGPMVAGFLGNSQRMKYTTIGDTVNTAARLESYGKELPPMTEEESDCRILVSATTAARLGAGYRTEAVGDLELKGKAAPVSVFKVLGRVTEPDD